MHRPRGLLAGFQTWRESELSAISGIASLRLSSAMILPGPRDLPAAIPAGMRLLGLDVGTKTIGTALSDTRLVIASPLETLRRRGRWRDDAAALLALVDRHDIGGLVVGLPLALSGGDTPRTQSVRQFCRNLLALRDLPIAFWDERLSTAAVTREMIAHDMTRKRRAEIVDRVAAAYILQGCLDAIGRSL
jgi:putative pre-16S rRNA nuclease